MPPNLTPASSSPVLPRPSNKNRFVFVGGAVILAVVAASVVWFWQKNDHQVQVNIPSSDPGAVQGQGSLTVDWISAQPLPNLKLFHYSCSSDPGYIPYADIFPDFYKVGTVTSGPYTGKDIVFTPSAYGCDDSPYRGYRFQYFILNEDGSAAFINNNSDGEIPSRLDLGNGTQYDAKITNDVATIFYDLIFPEKITYGRAVFSREIDYDRAFFGRKNLKLAFTLPVFGNVYTDDLSVPRNSSAEKARNNFYIKAPDGTERVYSLDIDFYDNQTGVPDIVWHDTDDISGEEYLSTTKLSCSSSYLSVVPDVSETDLVVAGHVDLSVVDSPGLVYVLKNKNSPILKSLYKYYSSRSANSVTTQNSEKKSYEEFLEDHPIFFWYDPLGRLIKFEKAEFSLPPEGC